jgi:hypothetical protein
LSFVAKLQRAREVLEQGLGIGDRGSGGTEPRTPNPEPRSHTPELQGSRMVQAQELIEETSARAYQPEVHECRARLAQLCGDAPTARQEIEAARRLYAEMGATAQVERLFEEH